MIRGVISENISYILLVQGKELIRWIDVKHGKTSIEVLSSVILSFGCYLNILEGWIVKTSYLVIVVFLSSCVARILNLNRFKYQASLESFVTYLTLSLITQFNGHSFWMNCVLYSSCLGELQWTECFISEASWPRSPCLINFIWIFSSRKFFEFLLPLSVKKWKRTLINNKTYKKVWV